MTTPLNNLDAAAPLNQQRDFYVAEIAKVSGLTSVNITYEFDHGILPLSLPFLSSAGGGTSEGVFFAAFQTALTTYLTAKKTAIETQLTVLGISP